MDETNKIKEQKKVQEEYRCDQIAPPDSTERLRCVDARFCKGVRKQARGKVAMHKCSHVNQLWSHSYTHCVRITGLHVLRRSRRYYQDRWTSRYGGWLMGRMRK